MFESNSLDPKTVRPTPAPPRPLVESKQHRMMVIALSLLLVALGFVFYRDRDFWFPATQETAEDQLDPGSPAGAARTGSGGSRAGQPASAAKNVAASKNRVKKKSGAKPEPEPSTEPAPEAPPVAVTRTVLPPVEVEVVAGNVHRKVRPGTNSVHLNLQPGTPTQTVSDSGMNEVAETAANTTSPAAEHVEMSADTTEIVSHRVKPGYPTLARQMKVQGSVILQALISRDGAIQDLHVVSGPPILASAAQEAVKQWRFKPHYSGAEAVETQAKITVNFTISTN
jgi:periplasmic protein TonB